jgi:tetratricopeptide (TPR) repeat protein
MSGEWNIAVAGFTDAGTNTIGADDAAQIGAVFYNRLSDDMAELSKQSDLVIQVWGPQQTGAVDGATPDERGRNAEALAKRIKADVVIYGTVRREGEAVALQPEFYVAIPNLYAVEEMVGQHVFGAPISIVGAGDDLPAQVNLNRELARRSEALSLVTRGLSFYFAHAYENALQQFQSANRDALWQASDGREVVYLFEGNAAGRAGLLDDAENAYRAALKANAEYARAYAGLAGVYYLKSLQGVTAERFEPDLAAIAQAVDFYRQAETAKVQPESADIPAKSSFGLAQINLALWWAGQDTLELAKKQFRAVLDSYGDGKNPRVQELAAESHARLGLIARSEDDTEGAIQAFEAALKLSTIPNRRGLYWATLADLYAAREQPAEAEKANRSAIAEYKAALLLTTQKEQQAAAWSAISARHETLGEKPQAIQALEQALELLPADSKDRPGYESRLQGLRK